MFSSRAERPSANALSDALDALRARQLPVVQLSDSNPVRQGLEPWSYLSQAVHWNCRSYDPDPRGLCAARRALAEFSGGHEDDYFLAASTSEAYAWLFKLLCNPGEAVLVPKPGYPLFESLAALECVRAVPYHLDYDHAHGWSLDIDELKALAATTGARAVIAIHPNNPTGSYMRAAERAALVSLCADAGAALIVDEVFFPYCLTDTVQSSFGGETGCLTLVLNGLSKLLCLPQVKLAWMRLSGTGSAEAARRLELIADTYLSAATPVMAALPALLPAAAAFTAAVRERLVRNMSAARAVFEGGAHEAQGEGSPYRILRCEGGWTALVEFPRYLSEEDTVLSLLKNKALYVQPGYFFDMRNEGSAALSLITEETHFASGCAVMRDYIDSLQA